MCGYDQLQTRSSGSLPALTVLNKRYLVGRVLGRGGFGITYLARDFSRQDSDPHKLVAIKEYMPSHYCTRRGDTLDITPNSDQKARRVFEEGRQKFIDEARTLSELRRNTIVVHVRQFFQENNTAYLVMEYLDGDDLRKQAAAHGGRLDPELATNVFLTVASGLAEIHRMGILHRDLSPDNIIVTRDEQVKLVDFGAARSYLSTENNGMSVFLKPGFAPPEQYDKNGQHGPWCDVYALCATYYNMMTGLHVPDSVNRARGERTPTLTELGAPVPPRMSEVISKGMALDWKNRYRSMMELLDDASAALNLLPVNQTLPVTSLNRFTVSQAGPELYPPVQQDQMLRQARPADPRAVVRFLESQPVQPRQPVSGHTPSRQPLSAQTPSRQPLGPQVPPRQGPNPQVSSRRQPNQQFPPQPPHGAAVVTALFNGRAVSRLSLAPGGSILVGREANRCALVVGGDEKVSRIHCELRFDGRQMHVRDLSSNGTYFTDGRRLERGMDYTIAPGASLLLASGLYVLTISNYT